MPSKNECVFFWMDCDFVGPSMVAAGVRRTCGKALGTEIKQGEEDN